MREFKPGDIVTHFKRKESDSGNEYMYEIVGIAMHSETGQELMVYRPLYGDQKLYARPLEMFMGKVDQEKYPDVKQIYRFEKVEQ